MLTGKNNEEKIWKYLKAAGLNDCGIAGLMGNLYAESGLMPNNVQNCYEKKLGVTDASYTAAVDSGAYTNFAKAAASLPDSEAAEAVELFPAWVVGIAVAEGERYSYALRLYKCVAAHTTQEDWAPDKTPAMWVVVDVAHAGTVDDPIPAARGMEYEYGKYYLDGEDNKTYLCTRTGEPVGGTVTLQYLPHELVGTYFEEV